MCALSLLDSLDPVVDSGKRCRLSGFSDHVLLLTINRIRHKKCDERLPSCSPCISTARKCDFQSIAPETSGIIAKHQFSDSTNLTINQLSIVSLNAIDSNPFSYFCNISAKEFSLYFESPVWESIILQAACTEPCIRHAALAIGATSRNNYHSTSSETAIDYAMEQYNLALRALNDGLDESARSWELTVLGSIVFIAFEVLWGVDTRVDMHLDGALAMLERLSQNGVGARMLQDGDSSGLAAGRKSYGRLTLGSAIDLGHLVSALSQLCGQVSTFRALDGCDWSGEGDMCHGADDVEFEELE
jgi:Fungal specific transcription factor domain